MNAGIHTTFSEVMTGRCALRGERIGRDCVLELDVDIPELLHPLADVHAEMSGRVCIPGLADDRNSTGSMHIAPFTRGRIRYRLDFVDTTGRRLFMDGWKSVSYRRLLPSMTTLPATITDESGGFVAEIEVRFRILRHLPGMLRSLRLTRGENTEPATDDLASRWDGSANRLEAWYTTLTDPATGTGLWLHHELLAPARDGKPHVHGWVSVFPPGRSPRFARFGPENREDTAGDAYPATAGTHASPARLSGEADGIEWELHTGETGPTLFTFPSWAWRTGLLPGAQVVPQPAARYSGSLHWDGNSLPLNAAPGATAHLYGHGNPRRWAWLHADLGGGDVAEVVAAVSTKPGLRRLPPLPFVRLRLNGRDWPVGDTLLAALRLRAEIDLPTWRVRGRLGDERIRIEVTQPWESTVAVDYTDPDGGTAVCRNSERSDAEIVLERRTGGVWQREGRWVLDGTAHAEVGCRE